MIVTPPEAEVIVKVFWKTPLPEPFDTILNEMPIGLANVPAVKLPLSVKPTPLRNAVAEVAAVLHPKQVLSKRM